MTGPRKTRSRSRRRKGPPAQEPAPKVWWIEPERAVSRNFEILKKANRADELFGPEPMEIVRAVGSPLSPPNGRSGGDTTQLPQFVLARTSQETPGHGPDLPVELSGNPEDWQELLRYLFPLQNSALCYSIGVCSTKQDESGARFVAMLGEQLNGCVDSSILLVEATFQRPSLAQIFGVPAAPGLCEMLHERIQSESECLQKSRWENLWVLPGGANYQPDTGDLENSFRRVYEKLAAQFRNLIIELPPVSGKPDLLFPYSLLDAVVLLVRPNTLGVRELQGTIRRLTEAKANLVGTILNDLEARSPSGSRGSWWSRVSSFLGTERVR